jgi:hypothetical protein
MPEHSDDLHGHPDVAALVDAVREFLERDVMSATDGRVQFHARVAANVLRMVEREVAMGAAQRHRYQAGLAALGFDSEAALAAAIRAGRVDDRLAEVVAFVTETVRDRLDVANPAY